MRRALLSALFALALSVTRARALDVAPLSAGETAPVDLADGALSPIDVEADATRITSPFTPPSPSDPTQVVPADAPTLFAALANHTVVVAFTTRACALCAQYAPEFARVAAAYAGAIDPKTDAPLVFATVDVDSGDNRRLAKTFGVTSAPFVAALRRGRWYVVSAKTGEVVVRPPRRFTGLLAAEPTARYVADAVGVEPLEPLRPHVVTLTDETIDAFVADPTKDVLVEFYAPWCGHCKRFEPFYAEVGAHFADSRRGDPVRRPGPPLDPALPARVQAPRTRVHAPGAPARGHHRLRELPAGVARGGEGGGRARVGVRREARGGGDPRARRGERPGRPRRSRAREKRRGSLGRWW